jgi:hypothetical protein
VGPSGCVGGGHDEPLQHIEWPLRAFADVPAGEGGDQLELGDDDDELAAKAMGGEGPDEEKKGVKEEGSDRLEVVLPHFR